jgi:hypothetical protein
VTSAASSFSTANASAGASLEISAAVRSPSMSWTTVSASAVRPKLGNSASKLDARASGTSTPPR